MTSPSRPATIDDLASYEKAETLATFTVDSDLAKAGILTHINDAITAIVSARGDTVEVKVDTNSITVFRNYTEDELQAKLESAQGLWDRLKDYRERQAATDKKAVA
jgi:hypothetical protein